MAKVYLLTESDDDNSTVLGVFSTLEAAETTRAGNEEASIETFELDALVGQIFAGKWTAKIDKDSGSIDMVGRDRELRHSHEAESTVIDVRSKAIYARSTISWQHAAKAAVEARQEWLAAQSKAT